jgi:hypothetical protein
VEAGGELIYFFHGLTLLGQAAFNFFKMKNININCKQEGIIITALFRYSADLKRRLTRMDFSDESENEALVKIHEIENFILPKFGEEEE